MKYNFKLRPLAAFGILLSAASSVMASVPAPASLQHVQPLWQYGEISGAERVANGMAMDRLGRLYLGAVEEGITGFVVFDTTGKVPAKQGFIPFHEIKSSIIVGAPVINNDTNELYFILNKGDVFIYDISGKQLPRKKSQHKIGDFNTQGHARDGISSVALTEQNELVISAWEGEYYQEQGFIYHFDASFTLINKQFMGKYLWADLIPRQESRITSEHQVFVAPEGVRVDNYSSTRPLVYDPVTHSLSEWLAETNSSSIYEAPFFADAQKREYYSLSPAGHARLMRIDADGKQDILYESSGAKTYYPRRAVLDNDRLFMLASNQQRHSGQQFFSIVALDTTNKDDNPQQKHLWTTSLPSFPYMPREILASTVTPVLAEDGMLYAATSGYLTAIDTHNHGAIRWQTPLPLAGSSHRHASELTLDYQGNVWMTRCSSSNYKDSMNCDLHVFSGTDATLAKTAAAKVRGDDANTGRVYLPRYSNVGSIKGHDLAGATRLEWQLLNGEEAVQNEGSVLLDGSDPTQLKSWRWPKLLAESINRAAGPLNAGLQDPENLTIAPIDSHYLNELWLPSSLEKQGYHVKLKTTELNSSSELPTPEWTLADAGRGGLFVNAESVGALRSDQQILLTINGNTLPAFLPQEHRLSRFHWAHDFAVFINQQGKTYGVMAGEKNNEGVIRPLVSQYRNRIWVKNPATTVSYTINDVR